MIRLDAGQPAELQPDRAVPQPRGRSRPAAWKPSALEPLEAEGNRYHHYRGKWFTLDSTADEPTPGGVIVRMEQIFAAYQQTSPPRPAAGPRPLRILVFASLDALPGLPAGSAG